MRHFESFSNNVNFMMMRTLLNFDHAFKVRAKRIICTLPPHLNLISNTSELCISLFFSSQRFVKHQFELGSIFTKIAILLLGVSHHKMVHNKRLFLEIPQFLFCSGSFEKWKKDKTCKFMLFCEKLCTKCCCLQDRIFA